jgi:hypothetical protein
MPFYRDPDLGIYHLKGKKLPKPCGERIFAKGKEATCLFPSEYLCDGPGQGSRTCDRPLCEVHATQTGSNKHLCPACRTAVADASGQRSLFTHFVQQ